jgi:hypothetical protein
MLTLVDKEEVGPEDIFNGKNFYSTMHGCNTNFESNLLLE